MTEYDELVKCRKNSGGSQWNGSQCIVHTVHQVYTIHIIIYLFCISKYHRISKSQIQL